MAAKKKAAKKIAVKAAAAPAGAFAVGDRVQHALHGRGAVSSVVPAEGPGEVPAYVVKFHRPKAKWAAKTVPAGELRPADERAAD